MSVAASAGNFTSWRTQARGLLHAGVPPHDVEWRNRDDAPDLFGRLADAPGGNEAYRSDGADNGDSGNDLEQYREKTVLAEKQVQLLQQVRPLYAAQAAGAVNEVSEVNVSRQLLDLLEEAACFRAPDRWAFLYKVLWRWHRGERVVLSPADEDGMRLHAMAKTVHREEHKMHAFLRFRERAPEQGAPQFVAWFEPLHDVLPQVARHFAKRMGTVTWLIATPQGTAMWDSKKLNYGPPIKGMDARTAELDDAGERLWLTYYRSTFNPARLNTSAMELHMPVRYWKNLPEGKLIPDLVSKAGSGARRVAQAESVGTRGGTTIRIAPADAQPERDAPTALDQCRRCDLWQNATQGVPGDGPAHAPVMLVGEQPGDQEDLAGRPFVGPAGKLLDRAMEQAGVQRSELYMTNAVKHFKWEPRGKRRLHKTPDQREITACRYWLEHEVAAVQPKVIVALGATALKSVLGSGKVTLGSMLGKVIEHEGRLVIATYHPSYVLRVPDEATKAAALDDIVRALQQAANLIRH